MQLACISREPLVVALAGLMLLLRRQWHAHQSQPEC